MIRSLFSCCVVLLYGAVGLAQPPQTIKLTLTPAKPPTPALRYQLLPDARVTISGDAAPSYRQALDLTKKLSSNQKRWKLLVSWTDLPLDKLPKDEMRKVLAEYDNIYELLDRAARCDHCNWGLLQRLRERGIAPGELDDILQMSECVTLLMLRARLEIADNQFDKVLVTLRNGLALARHTGETEGLHTFCFGVERADLMEEELDEFIGRANAPNVYYALTDLPTPLVGMRKALQGERILCLGTFPGLTESAVNLDAGNMTAKQIEDCVSNLDHLRLYSGGKVDYTDRKKLAQRILDKHQVAKTALIAAGRPREKVEAMSHMQVALLHGLLEYDTLFDQIVVADNLPYCEMTKRFKEVEVEREKRLKDANAPALALAQVFWFDLEKISSARVRTDRKIALLRTIEAIRFYAATHDGKLPPTLAAIKEVPIPLDPMSGKSFDYQLDSDIATLRGLPPGQETPNALNSVTYELRIHQKK
jgi:hypothetical protein